MAHRDAAIAAVRKVLAARPAGQTALEARIVRDEDPPVDEEIALFAADGRRHVVAVQLGPNYVSVNTAIYATEQAGGFEITALDAVHQGTYRAARDAEFVADLRAALDGQPEDFEPLRAPGVGSHPHLKLAIEELTVAVATYNADRPEDERVEIELNAPGTDGKEDVLTFARPDGTRLAVQVSTMPGGVRVRNVETDEVLLEARADAARAHLAHIMESCFADAENLPFSP